MASSTYSSVSWLSSDYELSSTGSSDDDDDELNVKKDTIKWGKSAVTEATDVDSKIDKSVKSVKEMQTELLHIKIALYDQSMNDLKKAVTMNDKSISILFAKVNQEKAERQEEMRKMSDSLEMSLKETKDRLAGASEAMVNVVQATFEEEKKREITLIIEKRDEEISGLKERIEKLEEALKRSQKNNRILQDRLKDQSEVIEGKKKRLSQNNDSMKQGVNKPEQELMIFKMENLFEKHFKKWDLGLFKKDPKK